MHLDDNDTFCSFVVIYAQSRLTFNIICTQLAYKCQTKGLSFCKFNDYIICIYVTYSHSYQLTSQLYIINACILYTTNYYFIHAYMTIDYFRHYHMNSIIENTKFSGSITMITDNSQLVVLTSSAIFEFYKHLEGESVIGLLFISIIILSQISLKISSCFLSV